MKRRFSCFVYFSIKEESYLEFDVLLTKGTQREGEARVMLIKNEYTGTKYKDQS